MTRRGHKLGPDALRISPEAALRAHTLEGAISIGRENEIGSLEAGKRADFVVLDENPLSTAAEDITQIPVRETWVDGSAVWRADD